MPKTPKKRHSTSSRSTPTKLKVLEGSEKSDLTLQERSWKDKELWLVQLPKEFDSDLLDGAQVELGKHHQELSPKNAHGVEVPLGVKTVTAVRGSTIHLVPSSISGKLKPVTVKGYMCIYQDVALNQVNVSSIPVEKSKVAVPHGLKQRYKPFGGRRTMLN